MIYVTGDIHEDTSKIVEFSKQMNLTRDDTIILLGDVCLNYFSYGTNNRNLDFEAKMKLSQVGANVLCIHGNHECRPEYIDGYDVRTWNGGVVYFENVFPNLLFTKDGEIYNIEGKDFLALGGAYSVDKYYRVYEYLLKSHPSRKQEILTLGEMIYNPNVAKETIYKANHICKLYQWQAHWWAEEQISHSDRKRIFSKIKRIESVDYVLSHTCPFSYIPREMFLPNINQKVVDDSTERWLEDVRQILDYKKWYCGHWHINKRVDDIQFLYGRIERIKG